MSLKPLSSAGSSSFNEEVWVVRIQEILKQDQYEHESENRVSIFNVPQQLFLIKPEAFIPQEISIGPYHHLKPGLKEMENFKVSSVRRAQKAFPNFKIHDAIEKMAMHEHRISSCYHRYLECSKDTLLWIMTLDACFLLEYLQYFAVDPLKRSLSKGKSARSHLVNYVGKKAAQQYILRDIMMLENQIPLFVLSFILEIQHGCLVESERRLKMLLHGLSIELSPFKMLRHSLTNIEKLSEVNHLLELLYFTIIPPPEIPPETFDDHKKEVDDVKQGKVPAEQITKHCAACLNCVSSINLSGMIKFVQKLKKFLTKSLKLFSPQNPEDVGDGGNDDNLDVDENRDEDGNMKAPLVEEIMIPSVEELMNAGVRFCATTGRLKSIKFDIKTATFSLPSITLDINTEVLMRNLVAYEATVAPGALVFSRYMELMNGIIDTEEDVKILREMGIIYNHMKSDAEVAAMFNSMSKSVRLTKVEFLDKVIEDVNMYYASRWSVRFSNFVKKSVFGSWKILTFLATIMLLLMIGLETLCSVYDCSQWLGGKGNSRFHKGSSSYAMYYGN